MKSGSRIIVMELLMPQIGEDPYIVNRAITSIDLQMLTVFNTKERAKAEWESLIKSANERFLVKAFR
jgi:hypothetical protein